MPSIPGNVLMSLVFVLFLAHQGCGSEKENTVPDGDNRDQPSEYADVVEYDSGADGDLSDPDMAEDDLSDNGSGDTQDNNEGEGDGDSTPGEDDYTEPDHQDESETDSGESDSETIPASCTFEVLRINARKLRDVVSADNYGLVAMSGNITASIDVTTPENDPRFVNIAATWLHQASPGFVTAGEPDIVRRYALNNLSESPAPVAELAYTSDRPCFGGDRMYWLCADVQGIHAASARMNPDGSIAAEATSEALPPPATGSWELNHQFLDCGTGPVVTIAGYKTRMSMMPTGQILEWVFLALDASNPASFGPPQILWEGEVTGLEGVSGWTSTLFNNDRMLVDGYYYGVQGWTAPGPSESHKYIYSFEDPANVSQQIEHTLNIRNFRAWQGDNLWSIEEKNVVRYDFSDQATPVETSRFAFDGTVAAIDIRGDRAFLAIAQYGLIVVEMIPYTEPSVLIDQRLTLPMSKTVGVLRHQGNIWVLADNRRLLVPDISHPESYFPLVRHDLHIGGQQVISNGNQLLVLGYDAETLPLEIIATDGLSQPGPLYSGTVNRPGYGARGYRGYASVADNILYVGQKTLAAIDIGNPAVLETLWEVYANQIFEDGSYSSFDGVQAMGEYLVCLMGKSLVVLKNNGPDIPTFVAAVNNIVSAVTFNGSRVIAARNDWENGITLTYLDFADPSHPVITHQTTRNDIVDFIAQYMHKLYYFGSFIYLVEDKQTYQLIHVMDTRNENFLDQDYLTVSIPNTDDVLQLLPVSEADPRHLWLSLDADGENLIQLDATACGHQSENPPAGY